MLLLSLAVVPLLIISLAANLSHREAATLDTIDWMIWAAFAAEYGIRLYLAPAKGTFFRHNLVDLVVVILPFLRPLRVARSVRMIRVLRAGRVGAYLLRGVDAARDVLTRHKLHYALMVAALVIAAGGLLVYGFEHNAPGANITSIGDGLWWAIVTAATIGYGDLTPVTPEGRGVAVLLIIVGVGLFGVLAASLASYFVEERAEAQADELNARLDRIERSLERLTSRADDAAATRSKE